MKILCAWICRKLEKYIPNDVQKHSALFYGINMAVYTILSTIGLIFIGLIQNSLLNSIIIISVCYINQTIGGGYHASTHLKCFLTMAVSLTLGIQTCRFFPSTIILAGLGFLSLFLLYIFPVILHPNRYYLREKLPQFTKRSRIITLIEALFLLILISVGYKYNILAIALCLSALSRMVAISTVNVK